MMMMLTHEPRGGRCPVATMMITMIIMIAISDHFIIDRVMMRMVMIIQNIVST